MEFTSYDSSKRNLGEIEIKKQQIKVSKLCIELWKLMIKSRKHFGKRQFLKKPLFPKVFQNRKGWIWRRRQVFRGHSSGAKNNRQGILERFAWPRARDYDQKSLSWGQVGFHPHLGPEISKSNQQGRKGVMGWFLSQKQVLGQQLGFGGQFGPPHPLGFPFWQWLKRNLWSGKIRDTLGPKDRDQEDFLFYKEKRFYRHFRNRWNPATPSPWPDPQGCRLDGPWGRQPGFWYRKPVFDEALSIHATHHAAVCSWEVWYGYKSIFYEKALNQIQIH